MAVATPCWPAPVSAMMRVLAHPPREQRLAEHVVDLVRAGVAEVLALEQDRGAAALAQPRRVVQRRRPADVVGEEARELRLEGRVARAPPRRPPSSSSSAGISVSGTKRPPNGPKRVSIGH